MGEKITRFRWERAVIGAGGPLQATTRFVLLVLATHAGKDLKCWPTTKLLSEETGLSERAVCTHLEIAEGEGWIHRALRREGGKGWKNYVYTLTRAPERTEPRSAASGVNGTEGRSAPAQCLHGASTVLATEPGANGTERHAQGTERDDIEALNVVQSNNVPNTSINNKGNIKGEKSFPHFPLSEHPRKPNGNGEAVARSWQRQESSEYHARRAELVAQGKQFGITPCESETNNELAVRICQAMTGTT